MSESTEKEDTECIDVTIPMPWGGDVVGVWYGNRKVRPVLAIHGWLDNLGTWNNLIPLMPTHLGVLCVDLPGHGKSANLPSGIVYCYDYFITVILRIMETYKWKKISILAHSMGARNSILFASIYPQKVEFLISIDIASPGHLNSKREVDNWRERYEKLAIELERFENTKHMEPPSYAYEDLILKQYNGTDKSVDLDNCKHIFERNVEKSLLYPDKYYFSRDARLKYIFDHLIDSSLAVELVRHMSSVPFCIIKGMQSDYVKKSDDVVIRLLHETNSNFEFHELPGTHHVHLNNAADVAAVINPFISKHSPPLINAWTIDKDNERSSALAKIKFQLRKQQRNWGQLKRKSKL